MHTGKDVTALSGSK